MSDTPRTDAAERECGMQAAGDEEWCETAPLANLARTLERELAGAQDRQGRAIQDLAAMAERARKAEDALAVMEQAITDPENQPSQFGTVPLTWHEHIVLERDAYAEGLKAALVGERDWLAERSREAEAMDYRELALKYEERAVALNAAIDEPADVGGDRK